MINCEVLREKGGMKCQRLYIIQILEIIPVKIFFFYFLFFFKS